MTSKLKRFFLSLTSAILISFTLTSAAEAVDWGRPAVNPNGPSNINYTRAMGGTSPNTDFMTLQSVSIYVSGTNSADVRLGVYTGGTLANPSGATLLCDAGLTPIGLTNQWITLACPAVTIPKNTPTWVAFKGNDSGFAIPYQNNNGGAGNFQLTRGRYNSTSVSTNENTAYPATWTAGGSFGNYWYSVYLSYTVTPPSVNGTFNFTSPTYSESEGVGTTVTTTVSRTGGSTGAVSVDCVTSDGTATTAGSDYTGGTYTLNWADGDTANKTCAIPINDDSIYEADETINLTINNPTGGAVIGGQNTAVLTITNNDAAPTGTPIVNNHTYAGLYDFTGTGGTLRSNPNGSGLECSFNASDSANLTIPANATIVDAILYWAGSMQNDGDGDYTVTFEGISVDADEEHTELFVYGGSNLFFFGAEREVTGTIQALGTGTHTIDFSGLTVYNGAPHSTVDACVGGWSLVVIYEDTVTPIPLRVINIYDGFEYFQSSEIVLTPSNFSVPTGTAYTDYDGKHGHITWEGDETNSGTSGGFSEALTFKGIGPVANLTSTEPTPTGNPAGNQFNSTIRMLPDPPCTICTDLSYGVDFDVYDVTPYLTGGETSVQTRYSSGQDLVLLSAEVISVRNVPVADLDITKSHTGDFVSGEVESFDIVVSNNGPSPDVETITVTDILPGGLTLDSWSGTDWNHTAGTDIWYYDETLVNGETAPTLTINVLVDETGFPGVNNTATVSSPTFDNVSSNDSSTDSITINMPSVVTSTKTVVDLNGAFADPGDTIRYTINIIESGGEIANNVTVIDNIQTPELTNMVIIGTPVGSTVNTTYPILNISGITVPANGTVSIIYDVDIAGGTAPGTLINNTASINNPNGPDATPIAPTVVVSQTIPGNKKLYFQAPDFQDTPTQPQQMNRVPITAPIAPNRVRIRKDGAPADRIWLQTPVLQDNLTITGNMSVTLQLQRNLNTNNRNVQVTVDYLPGPVAIGTTTLTLTTPPLSNTVTNAYTFPIAIVPPTPLTLPPGAQLRVTVDNDPAIPPGTSDESIFVYPYDVVTGDTSRLEMDVTTVVSVDSVDFYDAAYSGGSTQSIIVPTTSYIRAVVSDPFGSFDITSAKIDIINPNTVTVVTAASMTQVADSGTNNKTYEYQYTFPSAGPTGFWTANVTVTEGNEGEIIDTGFNIIKVVLPDIILLKSVANEWDPINEFTGPKKIPGADVIYTILTTNTDEGWTDTDSVFITDPIPANTKLFVDPYGSCGPIDFIDGTPVSGLSCTFTNLSDLGDDVNFSDEASPGPYIYDYVPVPAGGYDSNVTSIEINPKGSFNGIGGGNPSFQLKFRARIY